LVEVDGQSAAMPYTAITINCLQTLQVALHFAAEIAFDLQLAVRDRLDNFVDLLRSKILGAQIRIDVGLLENAFGRARADPIDVGQRRFDPFIGWNFDS
jgi:hypothetical protein